MQRGSIKDNILFGKAYEDTKFRAVIEACCLTGNRQFFMLYFPFYLLCFFHNLTVSLIISEDLAFIGIDSCVGEGGNSLSGGQIARIALARAIYQDKQSTMTNIKYINKNATFAYYSLNFHIFSSSLFIRRYSISSGY